MRHSLARRSFLLSCFGATTFIVASAATVWSTDIASLRDTLRAGLKCRRELEFEFVDTVVGLVEEGRLPEDLVLNTYRWARGKRDDIPFPYFEEALRRRAAILDVDL